MLGIVVADGSGVWSWVLLFGVCAGYFWGWLVFVGESGLEFVGETCSKGGGVLSIDVDGSGAVSND